MATLTLEQTIEFITQARAGNWESIDEAIADAQAHVANLKRLRGILHDGRPQAPQAVAIANGKPAAAKNRSAMPGGLAHRRSTVAAPPQSVPTSSNGKALPGERQKQIAKLIASEGPMKHPDIARAIGVGISVVHSAVNEHPFFERQSDGIHLTQEGLQAARAGQPAAGDDD